MQYQNLILNKLEHLRPAGIPLALTSITAPHEDPDFLTPSKYFSHNLIIDLSGQKNGFFEIILSFH